MTLIQPAAIFLVTLAIGWLVRRLVLRALTAWTRRTSSHAGLVLTQALRGPILIWTVILGVHLALESSEIPARYTAWSSKILLVLWVVSLTLMSMRAAGDIVRIYGDQVPGALPVTTLTQNLAQLAVVLLGIVILLRALGLEITPILTALGVGGLAVALALQDTLSNLFAGFYMAIARQIRLGDYIKLNTGEEGYVSDISWRSTSIRNLANSMIIIPNSKLAQAIVTNFNLPQKDIGVSIQVNVSYDCDPEHVEQVLLDVAKKAAFEVPGMLSDPPPGVSFDPGFGESSLAFTLGYRVATFADQYNVRHHLRKRIFARFREEGFPTPYPARIVYMRSGKRKS